MRFPAAFRYPFRDVNGTSPGLALGQSFWALTEREVPMETSLEAAVAAGYTFFEAGLREDRLPVVRETLRRFPLRLIGQGWAAHAAEAEPFFERAIELGAEALNLHLGHAYLSTEEAGAMIDVVQERAEAHGMPLLLETHRGRLTQDLYRTAAVIDAKPGCAITLDVSHYLVAGETFGGDEQAFHRHMTPVLQRTALIHGRISNGASVQVDPADAFALTAQTQEVWQRAMEMWLAEAPADALLVFEPELGPPPYAYRNGQSEETFSRTAATQTLVEMARTAWKKALEAHAAGHAAGANG